MSLGWGEGRYFDLWMLVHLMGGVAGGLSNVFFGLPAWGVFALGGGMMVAWELVELAMGVTESWENRVIDIVLGLAGVWAALAVAARLDRRATIWAFALSFAVFAAGDFRGWLAYRRRRAAG